MSILVVGSVAYDSVRTPAGCRNDALGGSATFFSVAGSYFAPVSIVAVVGDDFSAEHVHLLESHNIDTTGLEKAAGLTFRWSGEYGTEDVNTRDTLDTQLNVFAKFAPTLSSEHHQLPFLFLANIDPDLQLDILNKMESRPTLVALDTMNFWIEGKLASLQRVVKSVDVVFMDEGEARQFVGEPNLVRAARQIQDMGPKTVVIKRGEHGVLLFSEDDIFGAPAYPLSEVVDPTGAGDSFAGGFMGYLASTGDLSANSFRRATVLGTVMGSFAVENFSVDRLSALTYKDVLDRFQAFTELLRFPSLGPGETLPWRI